jgi:hypothetical protein
MSICLNCFHCKIVPGTNAAMVRCEEKRFDVIRINHPFLTTIRNCPYVDESEDYSVNGASLNNVTTE